VPTGAVLTAAIHGGDGGGGLTCVGVPHPALAWTAAVISLVPLSYHPAKSLVPLGAMPRSTGLAPGKTAVAGVVHEPPGGRLLASAPPWHRPLPRLQRAPLPRAHGVTGLPAVSCFSFAVASIVCDLVGPNGVPTAAAERRFASAALSGKLRHAAQYQGQRSPEFTRFSHVSLISRPGPDELVGEQGSFVCWPREVGPLLRRPHGPIQQRRRR
jgi:hypothetical protein